MKATLTIEVPDDFVKKKCERCPLSFMSDYTGDDVCVMHIDDCPLEIKENTDEDQVR